MLYVLPGKPSSRIARFALLAIDSFKPALWASSRVRVDQLKRKGVFKGALIVIDLGKVSNYFLL